MQSKAEKIDKVITTLINKQFELAGYDLTIDDVRNRKDQWYNQYYISEEKHYEWLEFGEKLIKAKLKFNSQKCKLEMAMVSLMWGLKFKDKNDLEPV